MKETDRIYKISTLYLLSKVDVPLTTNRLSFFLLKDNYTDYFTFQQDLGELVSDGYVSETVATGKTLYSITDEGRNVVKLLSDEITLSMKEDIDLYIQENKFSIHEDYSVRSSFYQFGLNQYVSNLKIDENGSSILEINIASSSEASAKKICANWKKESNDIYPMLIGLLMK